MPVTSVRQRTGLDGAIVVDTLVHLSPEQAGAGAGAVRAVISSRYRVPSLSVDEILEMREYTALGDALEDSSTAIGTSVVELSIARLGLLVEALAAPTAPMDTAPLLHALAELHASALRAVLDGPPVDIALS